MGPRGDTQDEHLPLSRPWLVGGAPQLSRAWSAPTLDGDGDDDAHVVQNDMFVIVVVGGCCGC